MSTITPASTGNRDADTRADTEVGDGERSYRYPGSPPFRDLELDRRLFKGRSEEAKQVFHSILSSDVFLLYAVSGMGKSSLLNAGVMHRLRARGYWPVSVRLNETTLSPVQSIDRQIAAADTRDTEVEVLRTPGLDFEITADTTLWDLLGSLEVWRDDRLQHLVLVLDQFEELFTLDWKPDVRNRFITQFGEVVRGFQAPAGPEVAGDPAVPAPNVKFCVVIREDSLGELEALAADVPQIMQSRFRLGALNAAQAESAIREPAMVDDGLLDTQPFRYSEEAAQHILEFLQETERAATLGMADANTAHAVDPSQLQIICQYVERRVLPDKGTPPAGEVITIEAADLGGADGLRSVLGDFYRRTICSFPPATQRSLRHLCEGGLISKSGRRLSLEREEIGDEYGVSTADLDNLVDQRLLRVEPRVGSEYYELSHDTLVKPILADRSERRKAESRRHRRYMFIAGAVALVVLGFLAFQFKGSDSTVIVGEVDNAGDVKDYKVGRGEQPTQILVEPFGGKVLDAVVTVTCPSPEGCKQDQLGRGLAERVVVPGASSGSPSEELKISVGGQSDGSVGDSPDGSVGQFTVTLGVPVPAPTLSTQQDAEPIGGSIGAPGLLAVYSVDVADEPAATEGGGSFVEVVVTSEPDNTSGDSEDGKRPPALDVELEIIDPSGGRTVHDLLSAGEGERLYLDGAPGQYLVVVRGFETSRGAFRISATNSTALPVDETKRGEVTSPDDRTAFAIDVAADSAVDVTVQPDGDLDAVMEIVDPSGVVSSFDSSGGGGAEVALLDGDGRHTVRVTGYEESTGSFEITASTLEQVTLSADGTSSGEVTSTDDRTAFAIDVAADSAVDVTVQPDGDFDAVMEIVDPSGVVSSFDSFGVGGAEVALLGGQGRHIVRVSGFGGSIGRFDIATSPAETQLLFEGEPVSATTPGAFAIDATGDQVVAVRPDGDLDAVMEIVDPSGVVSSFDSSGVGGAEVALLGDQGRHIVRVTGYEGSTGSYKVETAQVDRQDLTEGEPKTVATPAVFDVDVASGQLLALTADSDDPDGVLDLQVIDPDGFTIGGGAVPSAPGEPVTTILDGTVAAGSYQIIIDSSEAQSEVSAEVRAVESQQLTEGKPVTTEAPAVFSVDIPDSELVTFSAQPNSADGILAIQVGEGSTSAVSASAGEPATVDLVGSQGPFQIFVTSSDGRADLTATLGPAEVQEITLGAGSVSANAPASFDIDLVGDERRLVIVTPQGDDELFMGISSPGREESSFVSSSGSGEAILALLAGEGTHRIVVSGFAGGESFVIETEPLGGGP